SRLESTFRPPRFRHSFLQGPSARHELQCAYSAIAARESCRCSRRDPSFDAPKADMACGRIDRLRMTRCRSIAAAIVGSAEMRATLEHLARNPAPRITGIVARCLRPAARIFRNAARLRRVGVMLL